MTKLLIVESPAKAKTISKYLNNKYIVRASIGHIRDLPKSNKNAIDIDKGFRPNYEISVGKDKVIKELKQLAKTADEIVLASDPDREGEAIAWHILQVLAPEGKQKSLPTGRQAKTQSQKFKRITFNEITKEAVEEALKHPREIDDNLRKAQEARRVLDRLVGYDLSGLIWKKVRYGLSAGRVQSPALRILMEREREIRAFIPEKFWTLTIDVLRGKDALTLDCDEEPREEARVNHILEKAPITEWSVSDISEKEVSRNPYPPFKTSTLQQVASTRLGFSPSRTMLVAQKLYEEGHITYMRTDSTSLSTQAQSVILSLVEKKYGKEYVKSMQYKTTSKGAQEAHEAIRPSSFAVTVAGNTDEQKKLYSLIWARSVASQMTPAKVLRTKITTGSNESTLPIFSINGSRTLFDGWLIVDPRAKSEDIELPKMKVGESLEYKNINSEGKETQPPSRYTEAGLVKELEKRGIGRPSTYASIMKTLSDRGYVEKEGRALKPTDTGDVVSSFLENNFAQYISDSFTAEMEDELDDIASGKREYAKTLGEFYTPFQKEVKAKDAIPKLNNFGDADPKHTCPKCDSSMVVKLGRGGKFLSCDRFPECDGARTITGDVIKDEDPIGKDPETGEDIYLLTGRFGPYVQVGKKTKVNPKPKRASLGKDANIESITLEDALQYLSLPRVLGNHPDTGEPITASKGRFGPYIVHKGDFRSLKTDDVYTISLDRALEILKEEKKTRIKKK